MKIIRITATAIILAVGNTAQATSFVITTDAFVSSLASTSNATSDMTSSFKDDKIVLDAREDAATFIGSKGETRGARFESALTHIRAQFPLLQASDESIATFILTI